MARDRFVTIRLSSEEKAALLKKASDSHVEVSAYVREKLLDGNPAEPSAGSVSHESSAGSALTMEESNE